MPKIAFLFPGQIGQSVRHVPGTGPRAARRPGMFDRAGEVLGYDLRFASGGLPMPSRPPTSVSRRSSSPAWRRSRASRRASRRSWRPARARPV